MTPRQSAVAVRAFVPGDRRPALDDALERARAAVAAGTSPLADLAEVHFARFMLVPGARLDTGDVDDSLLYLADVDGTQQDHLAALATVAAPLLDDLFGGCDGYPDPSTPESRLRWLASRSIPVSAHYVNTSGLGVAQVAEEARLHDWLQDHVDRHRPELVALAPDELHRTLRTAARAAPEVAAAVSPPPRPSLRHRVSEAAHAAGTVVLVVVAAPVLLVVGIPWLLALRLRERSDVPDTARPEGATVERLRLEEDQFAFNPFAAMGHVKDGRLRRATVRMVLAAISFTTRHVFARGNLAGVTTIHFARWVVLDEGRRVVFTSCYDGSLESYMDDFIDKLAWGLNIVFSNGSGYPRTRWLVLGGARDEQAFKDYLRCHQLGNPVSYAAYPTLTTSNILGNARVRDGLHRELSPAAARTWLASL